MAILMDGSGYHLPCRLRPALAGATVGSSTADAAIG
jgi:hypothetical protein